MNLPVEKVPSIQVSEVFGPTYQDEGIDIGKPCFFLRLHHCPVHCPGCDTHYTWDGSEPGTRRTIGDVFNQLARSLCDFPGCGLVVSGGEPLIHYQNEDLCKWLRSLRAGRPAIANFCSLETSGYVGESIKSTTQFLRFLKCFDTVHLSPKITPCLHGRQTDEEALASQSIFSIIGPGFIKPKLVYKFVVRDDSDVEAVLRADAIHGWRKAGYPIYLMPYGIHRNEVLATCEALLPACAQHGFILSPRLHSIIWDVARGH